MYLSYVGRSIEGQVANKGQKTPDELYFFRIFLDADFLKRHWEKKGRKRKRNDRAGNKKRRIGERGLIDEQRRRNGNFR